MSRVLLTLLAICLVACGDSRDGPGGGGDAATPPIGLSCAEPTCQGDLTGTWDITGACIDEYDVVEERSTCAGWECTVVAASASGHLTFAADGSADVLVSVDTRSECNVTTECFDRAASCAELADADPDRTCEETAEGCRCSETSTESREHVGTWELIMGRSLSVTTASGGFAGNDWCVAGDELRISWLVDANSASPVTSAALIARRR